MRRVFAFALALAAGCIAAGCAHTAPPVQPVATPIGVETPTAGATPATPAIAAASPAPSPEPLASATPCPLAIAASYLIYSPIPPRPGEPPRASHSMPLSVRVVVKRDGRVLATKDFRGDVCVDVPPGPVTVEVTRCEACMCRAQPQVVTVPGNLALDCSGPQPPAAPPHR